MVSYAFRKIYKLYLCLGLKYCLSELEVSPQATGFCSFRSSIHVLKGFYEKKLD